MRQGPNAKRMRGRGNGRKNSNPRTQSFESNGPEVKVRGNAQQVVEKYLTLARDASLAGDRIIAESYFQHAEHYYRLMTANGGGFEQREPHDHSQSENLERPAQPSDDPAGVAAPSAPAPANGEDRSATDKNGSSDDPASAPQPSIGDNDTARAE